MITVIVPVKNVEDSLTKCLQSIKNQTYRMLQVILINTGSVDDSGEICDKFAKNDSRFEVIHTGDINFSAAKNIGLSHAQGEYICFINAVDWIDAEMLESLLVINEEYNADMITCRYYEDTISEMFIIPGLGETRLISKDEAIQLCLAQTRVHGFLCNKLYKLDLFNSNPIIRFNEEVDYYEDLLVAMQCFFKSQTIVYIPPPHYHYYLSRHAPLTVLQDKRKLTALKAIEEAITLLSQDPSIDTRVLKDYYTGLSLSSLFLLVTSENMKDSLVNKLRQNLHRYGLKEQKDKHLRRCCMLTRKNVGLGKMYWGMFCEKKLAE